MDIAFTPYRWLNVLIAFVLAGFGWSVGAALFAAIVSIF